MRPPWTSTVALLHWRVMNRCVGFTFRVSCTVFGPPVEWSMVKRFLGRV